MNEEEKQLTAINEGLSFDEQHRHRHEDAQTELLEKYTAYQIEALAQKVKFKRCFFVVSLLLMFVPPLFLFVVYRGIYFGYISADSYSAIASLAGGMGVLVADIMFLPKTIANYCFNKDEDANIMKLFTNVQSNDRYHNEQNSNSIDFLKRVLK